MIVTIGGIPVYNALISDEECGMFKISLVDDPAVMSNFQAFANEKKPMMYAVTDESRRLCRGCVMRADFPIYRIDARMGEYYVIYKAEEIRKMAEKYLAESRQNCVNLMHEDGTDVESVQMVQYFIKGDGVSVEGFDECADGSLFAEFHITDEALWEQVKNGTYKGFSLEGLFELVPEQDAERTEKIVDVLDGAFSRIFKHSTDKQMSKLSRFKEALAKALQEFGTITTDKGVISWDGDEDLKEGDAVHIVDAEGNEVAIEDGDYTTEDNKVIVVVDGKVAEIKDAEAEVAPEAETTIAEEAKDAEVVFEDEEGNPIPEPEDTAEDIIVKKDARIAELEAQVADLEAKLAEAEAKVAELTEGNDTLKEQVEQMQKMSIAKPAHEEMETSVKQEKTGVKALDNLSRFLSAK